MRMKLFAHYGIVAATTLAASALLTAFDTDDIASMARQNWREVADWSVLDPGVLDDDAASPNERARFARTRVHSG
ncbi:MAG TPA: hypothetical protein VF169_24350 [Albitalea sp.]|uniref:hypothetical protein n=1 Tax=Piscinibacter sp. TaxID=1903157 RepID=UPI002ED581E0